MVKLKGGEMGAKKAEKWELKREGKVSVWVDDGTSTEEMGSYVSIYTPSTQRKMLSCVVVEIQVLGKYLNNNTTCIFSMSNSLCVNDGEIISE